MKLLATLATGLAIVLTGLGSANAAAQPTSQASLLHEAHAILAAQNLALPPRTLGRQASPQLSGSRDNPPPCTTCPDPVTVMTNAFDAFDKVTYIRFHQIVDDTATTSAIHIDAKGDATCKGPWLLAHVTGSSSVPGTQQSDKKDTRFLVKKKTAWQRSKNTNHNRWHKIKLANVAVYGFTIDNPLNCPAASGGGGGTSTLQTKSLDNLGPDTFNGQKVWKIQAVIVDTSGQSPDATVDYLVTQDHFLLLSFTVALQDPKTGEKFTLRQDLTRFGKKFKTPTPNKAGTKP